MKTLEELKIESMGGRCDKCNQNIYYKSKNLCFFHYKLKLGLIGREKWVGDIVKSWRR